MSSYTVPPRASRAQRSPNSTENRDTDEQHLSGVQGDTRQEPAVQHCSGFHVIPPNPTKNAKLKETAQREEEDHRLHKEKQKERIRDQTSHPARVGGRPLSPEEIDQIRRAQERELKVAKMQRKEERDRRDKERRVKEQEKYDDHKQQQRLKAIRLSERKSVEDERRRDETRSKRLAYFDNL